MLKATSFSPPFPQIPKMTLRSARESFVNVELAVPESTFWASSFFFACRTEILSSTVPSHTNLSRKTQKLVKCTCIYSFVWENAHCTLQKQTREVHVRCLRGLMYSIFYLWMVTSLRCPTLYIRSQAWSSKAGFLSNKRRQSVPGLAHLLNIISGS